MKFWIFFHALILSVTINCTIFNGYELWDLDATDTSFSSEATTWVITNKVSSTNATQCSSSWILGGYQVVNMHGSFSKIYNNLPAHTVIQFSMSFWVLDCKEASDLFQIYFDGTLAGTWNSDLYANGGNQYPSICGGANQDFPSIPVQGSVPHGNTSLTFQVLSMYSSASSTFSFGFRDIHMLFVNASSPTLSVCGFIYPSSSSTQPSCLCGAGKYSLAGSSSCYSCSTACQSCVGPGVSDCTLCPSGYSFVKGSCLQCDSTCAVCSGSSKYSCVKCTSSNPFLYYDGSCQPSCTAPLVSQTKDNINYCTSPCSASQYLYQNGSCSNICPTPFVNTTNANLKFCNTPCTNSSYLYWNGSCSSYCPTSFQSAQNGIPICNFYCSGSNYLYWNNTCLLNCQSPLLSSTDSQGYMFCNKPCANGQFVYQDGSCSNQCNYTNQTSSDGVLMCVFPCSSSQYLYWNQSCISTCNSPLVASNDSLSNNYCNKPCKDGQYLYSDGSCLSSCNYTNYTTSDGILKCTFPCSSGQYFYWNQSCGASCNSPLTASIDAKSNNLCSKPCSGSQYLYSDGSCSSQCNYTAQTTSDGVQVCTFPCTSSQYLYWNQSCLSSCSNPLIINTDSRSNKYCSKPCNNGQYLYSDGSCLTSCNYTNQTSSDGILMCIFPCSSSQYFYWNQSCLSSCNTPLIQSVDAKSNNICNKPCSDSDYFYWNGSCSSYCPITFQSAQNGILTCKFYCPKDQYLYWNNTCSSSCSSPLIITNDSQSYQFCNKPCPDGQYLSTDSSCSSSCDYKNQTSSDGVLSCIFPCNTSQFLSWNTTCIASCDYPLVRSNDGRSNNFCNKPCPDGQYLYVNGSCSSHCDYVSKTSDDGISYCIIPCQSNQFLYQNLTCLSSCPTPYKIQSVSNSSNLCLSPCPNNEYYHVKNSSCLSQCPSPMTIYQSGILQYCQDAPVKPGEDIIAVSQLTHAVQAAAAGLAIVNGAIRPSDTNSVFMIGLAKMVKYVKYMDIDLPENVFETFDSSNSSQYSVSTSFTSEMPQDMQDKFALRPMPEVFVRAQIHSNYLINFWSNLFNFFIFFWVGVFFGLFEKFVKRYFKMKLLIVIASRLRLLTKWSFLYFIFFNSYDDITLYAILEFRTLRLDSPYEFCSFTLCLMLTTVAIYLLYRVFKLCQESVKKAQQQKQYNANEQEFQFYKKYEANQVMYSGFKEDKILKKLGLFILTVQVILNNIIIGFLFAYPLVQSILIFIITLSVVIYIIVERPMKDKVNHTFALLFEGLCLIANLLVLILVITNSRGIYSGVFRDKVCEGIMVMNMLIDLVSNMSMWIYILVGLIGAYKISRGKDLEKKAVWFNMLVVPYQNPGMDFDDRSNEAEEEEEKTQNKGAKQRMLMKKNRPYQKVFPAFTRTSLLPEVEKAKKIEPNNSVIGHLKSRERRESIGISHSPGSEKKIMETRSLGGVGSALFVDNRGEEASMDNLEHVNSGLLQDGLESDQEIMYGGLGDDNQIKSPPKQYRKFFFKNRAPQSQVGNPVTPKIILEESSPGGNSRQESTENQSYIEDISHISATPVLGFQKKRRTSMWRNGARDSTLNIPPPQQPAKSPFSFNTSDIQQVNMPAKMPENSLANRGSLLNLFGNFPKNKPQPMSTPRAISNIIARMQGREATESSKRFSSDADSASSKISTRQQIVSLFYNQTSRFGDTPRPQEGKTVVNTIQTARESVQVSSNRRETLGSVRNTIFRNQNNRQEP